MWQNVDGQHDEGVYHSSIVLYPFPISLSFGSLPIFYLDHIAH